MNNNNLRRELLAEFLGTFVMICFGAGVVAQFVLSGGQAGSQLAINLTWGDNSNNESGFLMWLVVSLGLTSTLLLRSRLRPGADSRGQRSCPTPQLNFLAHSPLPQ